MNELFDKEVNAQKESLKKTSRVHVSSHKPTRKCVMKIKEKKNNKHLKYFDGRKFIRRMRKTHVMDIKRLQVNDS